MSSILTNTSAMVALQTLKHINMSLGKIQAEISTGKRVESARDNAAIWAISKVMESDVKGFKAISESLALGESTISVARQGTETVTELLTDIKGKIIAAQEENVDRSKIQTDVDALREQITSVVNAAQFNGLNLIKGTADVNVLSSLDRGADGTVTASSITIARQDLTTDAGVYGGGGTSLAANAVVSAATVESSAATKQHSMTVTYDIAGAYEVNIGGSTVNVAANTDAATTATDLAGAINALGLSGIAASTSGGDLIITSTKSFDDTIVTTSATGGAAAIAAGATIEQRAETVDFSTSALVNEGDSYRVTLEGNNFEYIASKGETFEDVARGLKTAVDGGALTGVSTKVGVDATTGAHQLFVDYDGTDTTFGADLDLSTAGEDGGTASGGLFGLDNISVLTNATATAALDNIETLINNAIDGAAEFGSAEGRIEIQGTFISKLTDSLRAGIGTLVDANMEEASARLQALQVQQQLGIQSLSIANQQPQNLLALFR